VLCCRSTNTPRAAARKSAAAAAAGFSFRLEERAEKRKEVCIIFHSGVLVIMFCLVFLFLVLKGLGHSLLPVLPKA